MSLLNRKQLAKKGKQLGKGLTTALLEILSMLDDAYTYMLFDYYHRGRPSASKATVYSALNRMRQQGLVKSKRRGYQTSYQITRTGRTKLLVAKLFSNKVKSKDGLSSVVIFDIPEDKRKARAYLRRLLLKNGFINLQKSVMIGPYEMPKEFFELMTELNIRPHVTLLKSKVIYS